MSALKVIRITTESQRQKALTIFDQVYVQEKGWYQSSEEVLPAEDLAHPAVSWFLATHEDLPVGIVRVLYELPLALYRAYGFKMVAEGIDAEAFLSQHQVAEVGRYAVVPSHRGKVMIAAALMKAAVTESIQKGFSHYITDVFEADPHNPADFHQKVLGFKIVAEHDHGEIKFESKRITMLLDFRSAFQEMKEKNGWLFRFVTQDWDADMLRFLE
jgi:ribosomal protein S18 acetylase RimI-like enzyme